MWRKIFAALVVLGWVSLSCFDVVEDLDEIPCEVAVSSSSSDDGGTAKRGGWGPLANNSVESANQIERADVAVITLTRTIFRSDPVIDFRRHSQLHKLHRVFLI
jgi:hypothetical protein